LVSVLVQFLTPTPPEKKCEECETCETCPTTTTTPLTTTVPCEECKKCPSVTTTPCECPEETTTTTAPKCRTEYYKDWFRINNISQGVMTWYEREVCD